MNRFVAAVAALIGLVLVGGTLALGLIPAAAAGARLLGDARPIVIGDVPGTLPIQADVDRFTVAANRTVDEAFPAIAAELGLSPAGFDALLAREYPAVAAYAERKDELVALIAGIADNLRARQDDFAAAGSYPVAGVSPTVLPVAALVLGGLLVLAAAVLWRRPGRGALVVVLLAGLVLAGGSLALGLPEKAQAAQRVYDSVAITAENADASRATFALAQAYVAELEGRFVPETAQRLGLGPAEFADRFPALADSVTVYGPIVARAEAGVLYREGHVADFAQVRGLSLPAISWAAVLLGLLLTAVAVPALVSTRATRTPAPEPCPAAPAAAPSP